MAKKAPRRSDREGLSVMQLFQMFPDEAASRKWLEDIRWPDGQRHCPQCGSLKTSTVKNEIPMPYHCGECREYFSVKTGTVMQSSKVPLQKWVIAMHLLSTSLKGVSSMKLHHDLGLTQKTAWMLAQKIGEGWIEGGAKLSGEVEIDETFMGGKERNKHQSKQLKIGRGAGGKSAVVGAKKRGGKIKAEVIEKTDKTTLVKFVAANVESGSVVFTDEHGGYSRLSVLYNHQIVRHGVGEYVNGQAHTNGIESFRAILKRRYKSTHHQMSAKHFVRYVTEFAGRHNVRDLDTLAQMVALTRGLGVRQLRYDDLVAGNA